MNLKSPANVVSEKECRAAYGNRCNAVFLSTVMGDGESMRKLFHNSVSTRTMPPIVKAFWEYYQDHDKSKMLDKVQDVTTDKDGYPRSDSLYFEVIQNTDGSRILMDLGGNVFGAVHESKWADWHNYERCATMRVNDEWSSRQSIYYDNKSVAEVLRDTVQKSTYLHEYIDKKTGNKKLDLLLKNLEQSSDGPLHIQTYYQALKEINIDLTEAFTQNRQPLDSCAYMPAVLMLDELSADVFNQMDYKQQRVFHKSDLGQEILKFSYLTTQNLRAKEENNLLPPEYYFDVATMNAYLADIKNTDLWQVAARKITDQIVSQWKPERRLKVGSQMNNRLMELATLKARPKESMYADYWREDANRVSYMNLYVPQK